MSGADGTKVVRNDASVWLSLSVETAEMPLEVRIGSWVSLMFMDSSVSFKNRFGRVQILRHISMLFETLIETCINSSLLLVSAVCFWRIRRKQDGLLRAVM